MDRIYLVGTSVDDRVREATAQLDLQRELMNQIRRGLDALSADWDSETHREYDKQLRALGANASGYLEKVRGFLSEIKKYSDDYGTADGQGASPAKRIIADPTYMQDITAKLRNAEQALGKASQIMSRVHNSSAWNGTGTASVKNRIQSSITNLRNIQNSADELSDNLRNSANRFNDVTMKISGRESELVGELGENNRPPTTFIGGMIDKIVDLIRPIFTILPVLPVPPVLNPAKTITGIVANLRNGTL